jgi:hypothetical protein
MVNICTLDIANAGTGTSRSRGFAVLDLLRCGGSWSPWRWRWRGGSRGGRSLVRTASGLSFLRSGGNRCRRCRCRCRACGCRGSEGSLFTVRTGSRPGVRGCTVRRSAIPGGTISVRALCSRGIRIRAIGIRCIRCRATVCGSRRFVARVGDAKLRGARRTRGRLQEIYSR